MHARYVVKDSFYKKAKKEGYRARSAYKLEEIQAKFRVIKKGDRILDLGAAPGSWLQLESALVGEKGLVVGLDLLPIAPVATANVRLVKADIRELDVDRFLGELSIPYFDVVTCDIAPNLSGIRETDNARIGELYRSVKAVVGAALKQGGSFIFKSFFIEGFKATTEDLKSLFAKVSIYKPAASRGVSSEVYLICTEKK
jgi:23S rRNA (uridine2552-2'-O)-methyltransferase